MPNKHKKYFSCEGRVVRIRERTCGGYHHYELNYRRDGYNVWATARTLDQAKKRFIEKLHLLESCGTTQAPKVPTNFKDFTLYYFENFRKRKVSAHTYQADQGRVRIYLFPRFENFTMGKINAPMCQQVLDDLEAQGKGKTKDEVFSLMNTIFKSAIAHGIIRNNPLAICFHQKHECEHGHALTPNEEKFLIREARESNYFLTFVVALYTGLRPNEFKSARIDGDFIVAINSKQKDKKVHFKRIAISPMLKPYLKDVEVLHMMNDRDSRMKLRKYLPNHKLYDLRTTFYTRCQECGVSEVARNWFMGHSLKGLADTYTDLSDEYLLKEAQKLKY